METPRRTGTSIGDCVYDRVALGYQIVHDFRAFTVLELHDFVFFDEQSLQARQKDV